VLGYIELHIEQGPVLEAEGEALGVVRAIVGLSRGKITVRGKAGHAGTTPMNLRKDALTAAADMVLAFESIARAQDDLVATVGVMSVSPGAGNVIPASVVFSYDMRSSADATRVKALAQALGRCREIAEERGVDIEIDMTSATPAAQSDPGLVAALSAGIGGKARTLLSGAGHDAMVFRNVCPQAMMFVRSKDGLSHHPDEYTSPEDLGLAVKAMYDAVLALAAQHEAA
jgi:allantoate deiminase